VRDSEWRNEFQCGMKTEADTIVGFQRVQLHITQSLASGSGSFDGIFRCIDGSGLVADTLVQEAH